MGRVETFDHTADLGLRVLAGNLADLFRTAAEGLFDVVVENRSDVRQELEETVALSADSTEELLVSWLNELIYRCETQHRLYGRFDVTLSADGRSLQATIAGEPIDRERHLLDHEVKAVTYHGTVLRAGPDGWMAEVIMDI